MSRTISTHLVQVGPSTASGTARSHEVLVDRPTSKDGADEGPMGGELLMIGLGGCFFSNLMAAMRARNVILPGLRVHVEAEMDGTPERFTRFTLHVRSEEGDAATLEKLATIAERGCLVANTLRQSTPIEVTTGVERAETGSESVR